jgi:hypothetical protein
VARISGTTSVVGGLFDLLIVDLLIAACRLKIPNARFSRFSQSTIKKSAINR